MYKTKEEVINQFLKIKIKIEIKVKVKVEAKIHIIEMMNLQIQIRDHLNFIDLIRKSAKYFYFFEFYIHIFN
jgi:hypothetical protein